MMKLSLDTLVVESFATVDAPRQPRGTVEGQQGASRARLETCGGPYYVTCFNTCYDPTCDPSCRDTECITACQGGGELTADGCGGTGGGGTGGGGTGDGTGTDYVGCTNDCTTGMQTAA